MFYFRVYRMIRATFYLACIVLLLSTLVKELDACKCAVDHPQNLVCNSQFALVGRITKRTEATSAASSVSYTATVLVGIKGHVGKIGSNFTFETPSDGAACGISPSIGSVQLLMGRITNGKHIIISCDLILGTLTFEQMLYLLIPGSNAYKNNCTCKVNSTVGCIVPKDKSSCYSDKAVCRRTSPKSRSCQWVNNETC